MAHGTKVYLKKRVPGLHVSAWKPRDLKIISFDALPSISVITRGPAFVTRNRNAFTCTSHLSMVTVVLNVQLVSTLHDTVSVFIQYVLALELWVTVRTCCRISLHHQWSGSVVKNTTQKLFSAVFSHTDVAVQKAMWKNRDFRPISLYFGNNIRSDHGWDGTPIGNRTPRRHFQWPWVTPIL